MHVNHVNDISQENAEHPNRSGLYTIDDNYLIQFILIKSKQFFFFFLEFRLENCLKKLGENQLNSPKKLSQYWLKNSLL